MPYEAQQGSRTTQKLAEVLPSTKKSSARLNNTKGRPHTLVRAPQQHPGDRPAVSRKLISLVSQFEVLNAVSPPIAEPDLQLAPLHIWQDESRWKPASAESRTKQPPTIIGQGREIMEMDKVFCDDHCAPSIGYSPASRYLTSRRSSLTSGTASPGMPKNLAMKLRRSASLQKFNGSHKVDGTMEANSTHSRGTCTITAPYTQNESPIKSRIGTIEEIIRLYDDSILIGHDTKARPSLQIPAIRSTPNLKGPYHSNGRRGSSTRASRHNTSLIQAANTKTKDSPETTNKTNMIFGPMTPNPFLMHNSLLMSATSDDSLTSTDRGRLNVRPTISTSERIPPKMTKIFSGSPNSQRCTVNPGHVLEESQCKKEELAHGTTAPNSLNRKSISHKIEALYRAKGLEKHSEAPRSVEQALGPDLSHQISQTRGDKNAPSSVLLAAPIHRSPQRKDSKVSQMRKMFEADLAAEPLTSTSTNLPKALSASNLPFTEDKKLIKEPAGHPPPWPQLTGKEAKSCAHVSRLAVSAKSPLLPQLKARIDTVSPKTVEKSTIPAVRVLINSLTQPQLASNQIPLPPKSKRVGDKVKQFEEIRRLGPAHAWPQQESIAGKMNRSMRVFFEAKRGTGKTSGKGKGRGSSGGRTREHLASMGEAHMKPGPRGALVRLQDAAFKGPAFKATDGAMSRKPSSPTIEEITKLIVKEVHCGLKEPKPLRVAEMKRMILLCRDKVGGSMRDGRLAQNREQ